MKNILTNVDASPLDGACPNGKKNFVIPGWYAELLEELDQLYYSGEASADTLATNLQYELDNLERWSDGKTTHLPQLREHFSLFSEEILAQVRREEERESKPTTLQYWREYVTNWTRWLCDSPAKMECWKEELANRFKSRIPEQLQGKALAYLDKQFYK